MKYRFMDPDFVQTVALPKPASGVPLFVASDKKQTAKQTLTMCSGLKNTEIVFF